MRSDEAYQPLVRQVTIFAWIYHVQLILRYIIFTALEGLWVYDSIIIVKKNIAAEGRRQEIALVACTVAEVLMDFFLMSYLFKNRGGLPEDGSEDKENDLRSTINESKFNAEALIDAKADAEAEAEDKRFAKQAKKA